MLDCEFSVDGPPISPNQRVTHILDSPTSPGQGRHPEPARQRVFEEARHTVCALIITHNASPSLYDSIRALHQQVGSIFVIDNGSRSEYRAVLERIRELPYTEIIQKSTNVGIGAALNEGVRLAMEREYPWVLTFDQDSRAPAGFVESMLQAYAEHYNRDSIGLVAPRYREAELGLFHDELEEGAPETEIVRSTMMSGNLVRTDVIALVGYYDEQFFIDYVDHEFCLRMAKYGFRVLRSRRSILDHNLGRMSRSKFAGLLLATTNHSALRRYYNARNRVIVYRRHWRVAPGWVARDIKSFMVETAKILLLEQERRAKLAGVARGIWHGLTGRALTGAIPVPASGPP